MNQLSNYTCSAVIRDIRETFTVQAVSEKQAWLFFCRKYSFKNRDFKVIRVTPIVSSYQQISFI